MPSFLSDKKFLAAGALILMFALAAFLFRGNEAGPEGGRMPTETEITFSEEGEEEENEKDILDELLTSPKAKQTELKAVDGSASSGTAYLLTESDRTLHAVVAQLPEPDMGKVYEGWLVRPKPLNFFSTGVMRKNDKGEWILKYERSGDFPAHTRVVITEEETLDATPEKHIIEGDF